MTLRSVGTSNLPNIKSNVNKLLTDAAADEDVRVLAVDIVANSEGPKDPILAICNWMRNNVAYVPDPVNAELFTAPGRMARDHYNGKQLGEDCDGIAIMTTALARAVGIPCNVVLLDQTGFGYDHAVCEMVDEKTDTILMVDNSTLNIPIGWNEKYTKKAVL